MSAGTSLSICIVFLVFASGLVWFDRQPSHAGLVACGIALAISSRYSPTPWPL
jgi:hypothetical protein